MVEINQMHVWKRIKKTPIIWKEKWKPRKTYIIYEKEEKTIENKRIEWATFASQSIILKLEMADKTRLDSRSSERGRVKEGG